MVFTLFLIKSMSLGKQRRLPKAKKQQLLNSSVPVANKAFCTWYGVWLWRGGVYWTSLQLVSSSEEDPEW